MGSSSTSNSADLLGTREREKEKETTSELPHLIHLTHSLTHLGSFKSQSFILSLSSRMVSLSQCCCCCCRPQIGCENAVQVWVWAWAWAGRPMVKLTEKWERESSAWQRQSQCTVRQWQFSMGYLEERICLYYQQQQQQVTLSNTQLIFFQHDHAKRWKFTLQLSLVQQSNYLPELREEETGWQQTKKRRGTAVATLLWQKNI